MMEDDDDREAADMQMAIQMSLHQEQPQDNDQPIAGPSNTAAAQPMPTTTIPTAPIAPIAPTAPTAPTTPTASSLPKSIPKQVYADTLSKDDDSTSLAHLQAMLGVPNAQFRSPAQYHLYKKLITD